MSLVHVTLHQEIADGGLLDRLWDLYERGFRDVADRAVYRLMLFRSEFEIAMGSAATRKLLVWDETRLVGIAAVATDLASSSFWINPVFLARRYPEQFAAGRVHYILFIVVEPDYRSTRAASLMLRKGLAIEARENVVLIFDVGTANQAEDDGGLAAFGVRASAGLADLEIVETQRYFALHLGSDRAMLPTQPIAGD
jgi:hypothetical protein